MEEKGKDQTQPGPTVRVATAEDAAALSDFAARTFNDTFAGDNTPEDMAAYVATMFTPERQRAELVDPSNLVIVVEIDGTLAAYAHLIESAPEPSVTGHAPIELSRFYVDHCWHGRGLAHLLMDRVLDEARGRGRDTLWLGVWEHNPRAIAFYRKHGFVDVGSHPFVLGRDVQTDRIMQRPVEPA